MKNKKKEELIIRDLIPLIQTLIDTQVTELIICPRCGKSVTPDQYDSVTDQCLECKESGPWDI